MSAPALPYLRRAALPRPPRREPAWASALAGAALTVLLVLLMGSGLGGIGRLVRQVDERTAATTTPERVTFVDVPPAPLPEPERAAPAGAPPLPPATRPLSPSLPVPAPAVRPAAPGALPRVPAPPVVRDSVSAGAVRAPLATPSTLPRVPPARLPGDPVIAGPATTGAGAACVGPCAAARGGGVRTGVPLDSAGRAERLREVGASVADMARRRGTGTEGSVGVPEPAADATRPRPVAGVTLQTGLPGGGPTAAERRRTRELDAEVSAGLKRVRARVDSIRADSVRRADSLRKARRPPE